MKGVIGEKGFSAIALGTLLKFNTRHKSRASESLFAVCRFAGLELPGLFGVCRYV